jgi:predicted RNA binding protein YcfA (HicA-like mRNA interferase family)
MAEVKRVSGRAVIRAQERLGFDQARQRGSHVVMKKMPDTGVGCVVPLHRELAIGTLHGILKQAGVSPQDFLDSR